jgi:hypothetical protein
MLQHHFRFLLVACVSSKATYSEYSTYPWFILTTVGAEAMGFEGVGVAIVGKSPGQTEEAVSRAQSVSDSTSA